MPGDEKFEVLLRWFEAVNKGDVPLLNRLAEELFTADFMEHDPNLPDFEPGPAGVKKLVHGVREQYSSVHATVHDMFAHEDRVAYRFTLSMTEAASGKVVDVQLLAITRFEGGKIAEEWQLGARGRW